MGIEEKEGTKRMRGKIHRMHATCREKFGVDFKAVVSA